MTLPIEPKAFSVRKSVRSTLLSAGGIASVATVLGFFAKFWWVLELFSHFRVQYFLGLAVVALALLFLKEVRAAAGFALASAVNLMLLLPLFWGPESVPSVPGSEFRVLSLNVNTAEGDVESVRNLILQEQTDLVALLELSPRWIRGLQGALKSYPHSRVQLRSDNFGMGFFSRFPLLQQEPLFVGDTGIPSLRLVLQMPTGPLEVLLTHPLPPVDWKSAQLRNEQLDGLLPAIQGRKAPLLFLGDLNLTPWSPYFSEFLQRGRLLDGSRGWGVQPTWPVQNPLLRIPIDHVLHSAELQILDKHIGPDVGSDHFPVLLHCGLRSQKP